MRTESRSAGRGDLLAGDGEFAQARQAREGSDAGIGDGWAAVEGDLFERLNLAEELHAAVGDFSVAGEVLFQVRQCYDVFGGAIGSVTAVHKHEGLEVSAETDVAVAFVRNIHGHEFAQRGKSRQRHQRVIGNIFATNG